MCPVGLGYTVAFRPGDLSLVDQSDAHAGYAISRHSFLQAPGRKGHARRKNGWKQAALHRLLFRVARVNQMRAAHRSEEHTSELHSLMRISYAVFCLKKQNNNNPNITP